MDPTYSQFIYQGISCLFEESVQAVLHPIGLLLTFIAAYLLGSVLPGYLLTKKRTGEDIREKGTGLPDFANTFREFGKKDAFLSASLDFLFGFLSAAFGIVFFGYIGGYAGALFAVFGHAFPVFHRFKGGKGISTLLGALLLLSTKLFLVLLLLGVALYFTSKYASLSTIAVAAIAPLIVYRWGCLDGFLLAFGDTEHFFAYFFSYILPIEVNAIPTLLSLATAILLVVLNFKALKLLWKGQEIKTPWTRRE